MSPRMQHRAAALLGLGLTLLLALGLALHRTAPDRARPSAAATASPTSAAPDPDSDSLGSSAPTSAGDAPPAPTTDAAPGSTAPTTSAARTSIVVLRVGADDGVELVTRATKPFACAVEAPAAGAPRWRLVDPRTGALLAEGALALPRLCRCAKDRDHRRGCVVVHHAAIVRLKVPHLAPRERLELVGEEGPLASLDLPEVS